MSFTKFSDLATSSTKRIVPTRISSFENSLKLISGLIGAGLNMGQIIGEARIKSSIEDSNGLSDLDLHHIFPDNH